MKGGDMAHGELPHVRKLRANIEGSKRALGTHRKHCEKCSLAKRMARPDLSCDTGWQWHKDIARFTRQLERALGDHAGQLHGQTALF